MLPAGAVQLISALRWCPGLASAGPKAAAVQPSRVAGAGAFGREVNRRCCGCNKFWTRPRGLPKQVRAHPGGLPVKFGARPVGLPHECWAHPERLPMTVGLDRRYVFYI